MVKLDEYLSEIPGLEVFLSADEARVVSLFEKKFPKCKFHYQENPFEFHSKESTQKALADLYLLARTDHIIGSYYSSFSEMAYRLQDFSWEDSHQAAIKNQQPELHAAK
jgi:hypothetical protein